jgi:probable addiction module antidote protein
MGDILYSSCQAQNRLITFCDATFIAEALGDIARAKGMSQVARDAGLSRESLYKALSGERSPGFDTILKVVGALGLGLHAEVGRSTKAEQIYPEPDRSAPGELGARSR